MIPLEYQNLTFREKINHALKTVEDMHDHVTDTAYESYKKALFLSKTDEAASQQQLANALQTKKERLCNLIKPCKTERELFDIVKKITANPDTEF